MQDSAAAEIIETQEYTLHCYSTLTELRIIVSTHTSVTRVEALMSELYSVYTDFVLKNPFYTVHQYGCGQTVTSAMKLFHSAIEAAVANINRKN